MLRALLWYTQLPGYTIRVHAFEAKEGIESSFRSRYPEIKLGERVYGNGEDSNYELHIINCSVDSDKCMEKLAELNRNCFVFVGLGDDAMNMETANRVLRVSKNNQKDFRIVTVVYNPRIKRCVDGEDFLAIGDLKSFYSPETVLAPELCEEALNLHARWRGKVSTKMLTPEEKRGLYLEDYSFYSSIAKALHLFLRREIYNAFRKDYNPDKEKKETDAIDTRTVFPFLWTQVGKSALAETGSDAFWYRFVMNHTASAVRANLLYNRIQTLYMLDDEDQSPLFVNSTLGDLIREKRGEGRKADPSVDSEGLTAGDTSLQPDLPAAGIDNADCIAQKENLIFCARATATLEHIRWNAYMRSEGFMPATATRVHDKKYKKYKVHKNLVTVSELTVMDCLKDI